MGPRRSSGTAAEFAAITRSVIGERSRLTKPMACVRTCRWSVFASRWNVSGLSGARGQEEVMKCWIRGLSIVAEVAVVLSTAGACASSGEIRDAVKERYRPSEVELERPDHRGAVTRPGTVLLLRADGVPANVLRVSKPERPHPKMQTPLRVRHIENYARVTVGADGTLVGAP